MLDGSSFFRLDGVNIDLGDQDESALHIHGQGSAGPSHDITVQDSSIHGGARTVFILGEFAPSENWNHDLVFSRCDFACGTHNCFQISGGRDTSSRTASSTTRRATACSPPAPRGSRS